jgi:hypothetical protein
MTLNQGSTGLRHLARRADACFGSSAILWAVLVCRTESFAEDDGGGAVGVLLAWQGRTRPTTLSPTSAPPYTTGTGGAC